VTTKKNELPTVLPSLSERLQEAQERLTGVAKREPTTAERLLLDTEVPLTVRLLREARLKREMRRLQIIRNRKAMWKRVREERAKGKRAAKPKVRKERRRFKEKTANSRYRYFLRDKARRGGVDLSFPEWLDIFGRINPLKTKKDECFFSSFVPINLHRKDTSKPWTYENIHPRLFYGSSPMYWGRLELHPSVPEWKKYKPTDLKSLSSYQTYQKEIIRRYKGKLKRRRAYGGYGGGAARLITSGGVTARLKS
jgi:hypothetical protein